MENRYIILIIALVVIAGTIFYFEQQKPDISDVSDNVDIVKESLPLEKHDVKTAEQIKTLSESTKLNELTENDLKRIKSKARNYLRAKELVSPEGYINVNNITLTDNIGKKIILVDFWTYSCINCQRTFPHLISWYDKYKDDGFVIIGVHTPEFGFEEKYDNVVKATEKWGIKYPVVQDNDYQTWSAYKNRYWPRKYLIDIDGFIVYDHIGEGGYVETERRIIELLEEKNDVLGLKRSISENISEPFLDNFVLATRTPEIYFGYGFERGQMGNTEGWKPEIMVSYELPSELLDDKFYLEGSWKNNKDGMELKSKTGKIFLKYGAKDVNLVAGSSTEKEIIVKIDGKEVGRQTISDFDLYEIIQGDDYAPHTLELLVPEGVMVYTFTFG